MIKKGLTSGEVKRQKQEEEKEAFKQKRIEEQKQKKLVENIQNIAMGSYKETVINSATSIFKKHYGEQFSVESLINSIKFDWKKNLHGSQVPSCSINSSNIEFESDVNSRYGILNNQLLNNFIANDLFIDGTYLSQKASVNTLDERQGFLGAFKVETKDFIPTTSKYDKDKYGRNSKAQGLGVFTSKSDAIKEILTDVNKKWNGMEQLDLTKNILENSKLGNKRR